MTVAIDPSKITPSEVQENQIKINLILSEGRFVLIGLNAGIICGLSGNDTVDVLTKSLQDIKDMVAKNAKP